ncbi:MAG: hypothetical protein COA90_05380 [Gammaproteobacteria bacterium]|nr:MAG: hypothetical protein COA90_05380 [Gammaproteobacteria bacterium]
MLIIPFDKKLDWKNPPVFTFLLILVNVIVYFSFQLNDDEKLMEASQYYYRSGLDEIELPKFQAALIEQGDQEFVDEWADYIEREYSPWFFSMQSNQPFMHALHNDEIITPSDSDYTEWQSKRKQVDLLLNKSVTWSYSLKAGDPSIVTLLTHMFLHGDFSHLLGNMIFLLAVGFIVEQSMNRYLYLASYLFAGIGSALFYIPSASASLIPSIGASGAIAGLMGMYAILFNSRKVRFFYFIGFYFDYVKLPALYLFALWLGYEVFKQISYADISNINYMAHIGGLISGAGIAFLLNKSKAGINNEFLNENSDEEQFSHTLNQANAHIRELNHNKAVPLLAKLLQQQPENREILYKYYKTSKLNPGSEAHHQAAIAILSMPEADTATNQTIIDTFAEYSKTPKARLTVSLLNNIMKRCISNKAFTQAEKLAKFMQQQPEKFPLLPQYLRLLINNFVHSGEQKKVKNYTNYLLTHYPEHRETLIAKSIAS